MLSQVRCGSRSIALGNTTRKLYPTLRVMQDDLGPEAAAAKRAERDQRSELERLQAEDDLKWLMNDQRGRRIVYTQLARSGVFRISYAAGDPHQTSFNEGGRNVGNLLMRDVLAATPEQYALMLREATHDHP